MTGERMEMWGGFECTIHRIQDDYHNQTQRLGHCTAPEDIRRVAELGVQALRFPVLWEHLQPVRERTPAWDTVDPALAELRSCGIRPIVGLVHHGYGPRWCGLLDPAFPHRFAEYAASVAERYPWVDTYALINEPLTTARFSGLYGHWYPHAQDDRVFLQLLIAQCRAITQAVSAVRRITPHARFVQTDDLGKVSSTLPLAYQCAFENERRWLSWDLLTGKVDSAHPLWRYLVSSGLDEATLLDFVRHPCPPDIIGINHYVTSERFLDHRTANYAAHEVGDNGYHQYADVATASATAPEARRAGIGTLLLEAWERYRIPIAVTECHLAGPREAQLRWLHETWNAARDARNKGADVVAVANWALFGLYDWDSLLTRQDGHYEAGAYDLRGPKPRPTAVATMVRSLAHHGTYSHPVLTNPGWWVKDEQVPANTSAFPKSARPLLITGARGTLGQALSKIAEERGIPYLLLDRRSLDIADRESIRSVLRTLRPWAVINAAGYVRVDDAEQERHRCWRENVYGPELLAAACAKDRIPLVTYSSDLVFDGQKGDAYTESDQPSPCCWYGESKAACETSVLAAWPASLVVRTSAFFGPWDAANLVTRALSAFHAQELFSLPAGVTVTPTYVPDLAHATLDLLIDGAQGIWHLTNETPVTWSELVQMAAERLSIPAEQVMPILDTAAPDDTPSINTALASERAAIMPSLDDALDRYARYAREWPIPDLVTSE